MHDMDRVLICKESGTTSSIVQKRRGEYPAATDGFCPDETGAEAYATVHDALMFLIGDALVWGMCVTAPEAERESESPTGPTN